MNNLGTISIDKDFKKEVKKFSVEHDISLKELVELALKQYMEAHDE